MTLAVEDTSHSRCITVYIKAPDLDLDYSLGIGFSFNQIKAINHFVGWERERERERERGFE